MKEIEVRFRATSSEELDEIKNRFLTFYPLAIESDLLVQRNHYFQKVPLEFSDFSFLNFDFAQRGCLISLLSRNNKFSIRSRVENGRTYLVIKGSNENSVHGVSRDEFQEEIDIDIDSLDTNLVESGFSVTSKWSRSRVEYKHNDITLCLDFTPGYGYMGELECKSEFGESQLMKLIEDLKIAPLDMALADKMYEYYENNWEKYYSTDKVFSSELMQLFSEAL